MITPLLDTTRGPEIAHARTEHADPHRGDPHRGDGDTGLREGNGPRGAATPSAARDFLETKGDLRPIELVTCLVVWLADARGFRSVSARDVRAHYRPRDRPPTAAPVRSAADALRRAERAGLLGEVAPEAGERPAAGGPAAGGASPLTRGLTLRCRPDTGPRFVATPLGRLVVDTLPDKRGVKALRALPGAAAL